MSYTKLQPVAQYYNFLYQFKISKDFNPQILISIHAGPKQTVSSLHVDIICAFEVMRRGCPCLQGMIGICFHYL